MFYPNSFKTKNITYRKYSYASFANGIKSDYDEKLLPIKYATSTYNFCYQNGALRTGLGIEDLKLSYTKENRDLKNLVELPEGVKARGIFIYNYFNHDLNRKHDFLIVYGSDNDLYATFLYGDAGNFIKFNQHFSSCPMFLNYNINGVDCLIIITEKEGMYIWDSINNLVKVEDAPNMTSVCMHYERLYATIGGESKSIYFSDDLDPTNWAQSMNEGGFINLVDERGTSNKIVSFNDCLYVFREFGIDKIIAYADQSEFQVIPLFTSSTRIYTDTIRICGDRIIFLATDGIYYFSGLSTVKYNLNINNLFEKDYNDNAKGAYYNGKYYLACKLDFEDDEVVGCESENYLNNVLLELDIKTGDLNILRGYDIRILQSVNSQIEGLLFVGIMVDGEVKLGQLSKDGKVFGIPTRKVWKSPKSSFGINQDFKLLKSLSITSKSDIKIIIRADSQIKIFYINGSEKINTIHPNIKAKEFAIDFVCEKDDANISNPQIVVGFL